MTKRLVSILSIAGSDSCGGAGIQADIKAAAYCGVYASTAITAVTAQSTGGVDHIIPIKSDDVVSQLSAVFSDQFPDAIKIGMIGSVDTGNAVVSFLKDCGYAGPIVVDPVLSATSGNSLCDDTDKLLSFYKNTLFPVTTVVTPNLSEASKFLDNVDIRDFSQLKLAEMLYRDFGCNVVLKGGHSFNNIATDILFAFDKVSQKEYFEIYESEKYECNNLHGTGCTFSSILASALASGKSLSEAFRTAASVTKQIIKVSNGYSYGTSSNGPLNLFDYKHF